MIGGLIFDVLVVAAVLAFSWGAAQLGGISALGRLFEITVAFVVAALLREPAGDVVESLLGTSEDVGNLVGMLVVALVTWLAAHRVFRWWRARRAASRLPEDEDDIDFVVDVDRLDAPLVARIAGGVLGLGWALLFVAMLVLQPASTPISRSAIDSRIGGVLISGQDTLEWLRDGFPHYTQTLPKGKLGAVVGEQSNLPMREPVEAKDRNRDADELLRSINDLRRNSRVRVLAFNPDVAGVARRHSLSLASEQALSYRTPGGGTLDSRVLTALGESSGAFSEDVGIEVLWAHDPATAMGGLLDSSRARALLRDPRWTEIGIGVADAGWFNGRIYTLLLVGTEPTEADQADEADDELVDDGAAGAAEALGIQDPGDAAGDECDAPEPFDLDGDGISDEESVPPDTGECQDTVTADPTDPLE